MFLRGPAWPSPSAGLGLASWGSVVASELVGGPMCSARSCRSLGWPPSQLRLPFWPCFAFQRPDWVSFPMEAAGQVRGQPPSGCQASGTALLTLCLARCPLNSGLSSAHKVLCRSTNWESGEGSLFPLWPPPPPALGLSSKLVFMERLQDVLVAAFSAMSSFGTISAVDLKRL